MFSAVKKSSVIYIIEAHFNILVIIWHDVIIFSTIYFFYVDLVHW